jgi:hypothetical protein
MAPLSLKQRVGGGRIVAEYFDIGQSRSLPWKRRPQAALLLDMLRRADRGFAAVVIGEPARAFYGHQFSLTFPMSGTNWPISQKSGSPTAMRSRSITMAGSALAGRPRFPIDNRSPCRRRSRAAAAADASAVVGSITGIAGHPSHENDHDEPTVNDNTSSPTNHQSGKTASTNELPSKTTKETSKATIENTHVPIIHRLAGSRATCVGRT